jgi:hypothetical protein
MDRNRWYYFLSIERDFQRTIDYVDLHPDNHQTFSNEYAKLMLLIGSEVDVVAKLLCADVSPSSRRENILDYCSVITQRFSDIHDIEIKVDRYPATVKPWSSWAPGVEHSPDWWTAHNKVKHERDAHFPKANLENTLHGLCGLMTLLLYLHRDDPHLQPYPQLLNWDFPDYVVSGGGKKLPST